MPDLTYPTSLEIKGPLLMDTKSLRELDTVLSSQVKKLREAQEGLIPSWIEEKMSRATWRSAESATEKHINETRARYAEEARKELLEGYSTEVKVQFSNGSLLEATSLEEAANHPEILNSHPVGFEVRVRAGSVSARIGTDRFDPDLELSVSPSSYEPAQYFFSSLRTWARSIQAPRWQRVWTGSFFLRAALWCLWFTVSFTWFGAHVDVAAKNYYKEQAHRILKDGVSSGNEQKAIETLLALQSDYSPPAPPEPLSRRFWFFALGGLMVCLVLSFPPGVEIGIGRGEQRIVLWRRWIKFVFVAVPSFIASAFVWPSLAQAIKWAAQ